MSTANIKDIRAQKKQPYVSAVLCGSNEDGFPMLLEEYIATFNSFNTLQEVIQTLIKRIGEEYKQDFTVSHQELFNVAYEKYPRQYMSQLYYETEEYGKMSISLRIYAYGLTLRDDNLLKKELGI